ncbi:MAG TPA: UDP-N-acetylmuramoyl-tripeptide--D-alanyl-D-alanine ligase [Propionibacteriaceae bacterium]|nr:UDP-N-acetylmuramoyl-tripeptide--D-alanyl-D-alanine ligase [Propionibacteriaceae bacterium]
MELTPLGAVARAVSGEVRGGDADLTVGPDVVVDSRLATPGSLFVALPGEHVDGHDYVAAAAGAGAKAALVSRPTGAPLAEVVVDDPLAALADLARVQVAAARARGLRTVAITGSAGKTSTKDLLAQVLEQAGDTVAPRGSFNNEIGLPLTALAVGTDTGFLVAEMGARGGGHIRTLTDIVPPDVSVVCNVGTAHLGEFGSVEAIAEAKGEIVEALTDDGWAVLNADDHRVLGMASRTSGHVLLVSAAGDPGGDHVLWAEDVRPDERERYGFVLRARDAAPQPVQLQVTGRHMVSNALSAAGAAVALGLPLDLVARALSDAGARSRWRMEVHDRPDGVTIVNDAYNANPDSTRAALDTVSRLVDVKRAAVPDAKLFVVLGDMLELGDETRTEHVRIGRYAAEAGAALVLAVGAEAQHVVSGAAAGGADALRLNDKSEALAQLQGLRPGDVVLVKASRGVGLETVAADLLGAAW